MNKLVLKEVGLPNYTYKTSGEALGYCAVCKKRCNGDYPVKFIYHQNNAEALHYSVSLCSVCYGNDIENKPLNALETFIPLLKLKPNRRTKELLIPVGQDGKRDQWEGCKIYSIDYHPSYP